MAHDDVLTGGTAEPPDPERVRTPEDFSRELRRAQARTGLSVRGLATRSKVPPATVQDYLSGKHLPTPAYSEPFKSVLVELGEGDPERIDQWLAALVRIRRVPGPRSSQVPRPYRGLDAFTEADAGWFYGREEISDRIVDKVAERIRDGGGPLLVVGVSGAGKSSLLQAGVIPGLRSRGFEPILMMPDTSARAELEAMLAVPAERPRVLVIDHFEDVFDPEVAEEERLRFVDAVCRGRTGTDDDGAAPGFAAVLGMRSESYTRALRYPPLAAALETDQIVVQQMSPEQLRRAIGEPARKAGLDIDDSLVDLLLREAFPHAGGLTPGVEHDAGVLPLLSHALEQTWKRQHASRLTVADYLASGGIAHSIAQTADAEFEALPGNLKEAARLLFLRLVRTEEDTADSRRRCSLAEVLDQADSTPDMEDVVERFTDARLLITGDGTVEIAHEALLREWPRLKDWLDIDRTWRWMHRRITDAAAEWRERGDDPDLLYRGRPLQGMREWVEDRGYREDLNTLEREFCDASIRHRREQEVRERRRVRRRYRFGATLAVMAVVVASVSLFARQQSVTNDREQLQSRSRQVADESESQLSHDVSLSMQLAMVAYRISPTEEARSALLDATGVVPDTHIRPVSGTEAKSIAVAGDSLVEGAVDGLYLSAFTPTGRVVPVSGPLPGSKGTMTAVAVDRDAHLVAGASSAGDAYLWDVSDPTRASSATLLPMSGAIAKDIAVSADGHLLAAGLVDGTVWLWDTSDARHPRKTAVISGSGKIVNAVTFAPVGGVLAIGSEDGTVRLFRVGTLSSPTPLSTLSSDDGQVFSVAFGVDGKVLAAGFSKGHDVRTWNVTDPAHPASTGAPLTDPATWVNKVDFSPDGKTLAAASSDGHLWLYDLQTRQAIDQLPHPDPVTGVDFRADGSVLTVTSDDGTIHWWRRPGPVIKGARAGIFSLSYSADGGRLGISPGAGDNTASLWDIFDIHHPTELGPPLPGSAPPAEFSGSGTVTPDGKLFAIGDRNGTVQLWDIAVPASPVKVKTVEASSKLIEGVFVNRRGDLIATAADDGTVRLIRVADPQAPVSYPTIHVSSPTMPIYQAVFSPDSRLLIAVSEDQDAYLYDVSDPAHAVLQAKLGGFASAAYSAAFTHDGRYLAVGSADGSVRLWDVQDPIHPAPVGGPIGGPVGYIYWLSFAPDRNELAMSGNESGAIWLWDLSNPRSPVHTATLAGPLNGAYSVAFSPDGRTLVAGGTNGTVQMWNTSVTDAAAWICSVAGEPMTETQWRLYVPGQTYRPVCPAGR